MAKESPGNSEKRNLSDKGSQNYVIVIGRQFGSGGRTIGRKIASKLGIEYYDTELLSKAAKSLGISPQVFKDHDEKKPSTLRALLQGAYGIADNFHSVPLTGERIYDIQCRVIKDIASKGSCVIVGRNADFILRNHPRLLSVFLNAPLEWRAEKILARGEAESIEAAMDMAREHDKRRESFYNFYTGEKSWGVASNYHLCIDTSRHDEDIISNIIISMIPE